MEHLAPNTVPTRGEGTPFDPPSKEPLAPSVVCQGAVPPTPTEPLLPILAGAVTGEGGAVIQVVQTA